MLALLTMWLGREGLVRGGVMLAHKVCPLVLVSVAEATILHTKLSGTEGRERSVKVRRWRRLRPWLKDISE